MKRNYDMKQGILAFLMALGVLGLAACDADPIDTTRGELPDKEPLENTYVKVRSMKSATEFSVVNLTEGSTVPAMDQIYCQLTRPAEKTCLSLLSWMNLWHNRVMTSMVRIYPFSPWRMSR